MLEKPPLNHFSPDSYDPKWIQVKFAAEVNEKKNYPWERNDVLKKNSCAESWNHHDLIPLRILHS